MADTLFVDGRIPRSGRDRFLETESIFGSGNLRLWNTFDDVGVQRAIKPSHVTVFEPFQMKSRTG